MSNYSQADLNAIAAAQAAHPTLPPGYLTGVAQLETGGSSNPDTAASGTGPVGLFQVAPSTYINPGYGLPNQNLTYAQAQAALQDPNTNAAFAASYLDALQAQTGSLASATQIYSGGGYNQAAVEAAESQFPGGSGIASSTAPVSGTSTTAAGGPTGSAASGAGSGALGLLTPVWELVTRAMVFGVGTMLLFIALIALLWQSKTVQVNVASLGQHAADEAIGA